MTKESEIQSALRAVVDAGELAGAATLVRHGGVWRGGEPQILCAGWRDVEGRLPIERDTIFRIASMTKPIASVAAITNVGR